MTTAAADGQPPAPFDPRTADRVALREQTRLLRAKTEYTLAKLGERQLKENLALFDGFGGSDQWDTLRGRDGVTMLPPSIPSDRRHGANWPIFRTEQELARFRQESRALCTSNQYAKGLLKNLVNYTVGHGLSLEVAPADDGDAGAVRAAGLVQAVLDRFGKVNGWKRRTREMYRRIRRDGECFLRLFRQEDGTTLVRFIEPEQVQDPAGPNYEEGWSFGIRHQMEPHEDVETPLEYHVAYAGDLAESEFVPACDVVHIKNVDDDATVKRGLPDFVLETLDAFKRAGKLAKNLSAGAAIRAATAEIWQHAGSTQGQVTALASAQQQYVRTDPVTDKPVMVERIGPGTVRRIPQGQELVPQPPDQTPGYIAGLQSDLRAGATAFCAPEYMTGDASNADYSSTKEAGAPFVKASSADQEYFIEAVHELVSRVLRHAIDKALLPSDAMRLVDVQIKGPPVLHKNPLEAAQADQINVQIGAKSPQTVTAELGLDADREMQQAEAYRERMGQLGGLPLPSEDGKDVGDGLAGGGGLPGGGTLADRHDDGGSSANTSNKLRATVGGLNAIADLQAAYYGGRVPRVAAVNNAIMLLGFTADEASRLFPEVAPVKLTPADEDGGAVAGAGNIKP